MNRCYVFDMDGTLALKGDRDIHDYAKVGIDLPNKAICQTCIDLAGVPFVEIVICSGRQDFCKTETESWLDKHIEGQYDDVFMRKTGDNRPDDIVKKELLDEIRKEYEIIAWFDDRDKVVKMLRENGVTVCQVNYGDF